MMELLAVKLFVAFRFKVKLLRSCFLSRANILRWTKMLQVCFVTTPLVLLPTLELKSSVF